MTDYGPEITALRQRLTEEEAAYARVLAAVDALAVEPSFAERLPALPAQLEQLNHLWRAIEPPQGSGIAGRHRAAVWGVVQPALARQEAFDSQLVQLLNGFVEETSRLHHRVQQLVSAAVGYMQRVQPMVDARDRLGSALATARAELILEAFDRRQEEMARRLDGLEALRHGLENASERIAALRDSLAREPPAPATAAGAVRAMDSAVYEAFQNVYRGEATEIRERLTSYVERFRGREPVVDLGCGRGEFLGLLRDAGIEARGVDSNARAVQACREQGLDAVEGDLLGFLASQPAGTFGGVFAAQVAEHLAPAAVQALLAEAHRVLRGDGLLVLETVNPRSLVGLLEVFQRDLTHEKPLHPDTLSFLAAAAGFTDVRIEYLRPVERAAQLQDIPSGGLPEAAVRALNENVARLNALLYGPQEFALLARR